MLGCMCGCGCRGACVGVGDWLVGRGEGVCVFLCVHACICRCLIWELPIVFQN